MESLRQKKNEIISFYTRSFERHVKYNPGVPVDESDAWATQWCGKASQITRFQVLLKEVKISGKELLDVGCGLGTLVRFLRKHRIEKFKYTGVDIVPDFVSEAQKRFPECQFHETNILDYNGSADIVYCSGALTYKVQDNTRYYQTIIRKMWESAKETVIFNMLRTNRREWPDGEGIYAFYNPDLVRDYCHNFCDDVKVIEGYDYGDFSIRLQRKVA